jgi:DNA-binding response OmpR family regulator
MKRILYVEDNLDTASAVKTILSNAGYFIETVFNGADCLKKSNENFDLYLLDIMLPDMSGWAIYEILRKKKNLKVAFISAIPISNDRRKELILAGVCDYITKPFTKEILLEKVKEILG